MELNEQSNLILRITEYALIHDKFTIEDLKQKLNLKDEDLSFVQNTVTSQKVFADNPNQILVYCGVQTTTSNEIFKLYRLLPTAYYNYVDYLEIKQARQQATDAKFQSSLALMVAVGSLVIGSFIGLLGIIVQLLLTK